MSKPAIPAVPPSAAAQGRQLFDSTIKENIERINGLRGGLLTTLETNASNAEIIAKINEIIDRLQ